MTDKQAQVINVGVRKILAQNSKMIGESIASGYNPDKPISDQFFQILSNTVQVSVCLSVQILVDLLQTEGILQSASEHDLQKVLLEYFSQDH